MNFFVPQKITCGRCGSFFYFVKAEIIIFCFAWACGQGSGYVPLMA
ncbi:hypothetical protein KL86DES1_10200 [uncultured Desulfovibrio sp.]|uniref:Uncharacterized protein n=1 Tax=uncultured Desulfovibrio sp. TaxID=167968 RepID=A0A212KXW3_9BACT|nr:hypothetical protein KL86DES1_10200 [uncultured Desulfovibrio sp.]VZH35412.1 conserved protein of unknown function [Desulfovibrio sp. 86]